jgi:hypothetical protein
MTVFEEADETSQVAVHGRLLRSVAVSTQMVSTLFRIEAKVTSCRFRCAQSHVHSGEDPT